MAKGTCIEGDCDRPASVYRRCNRHHRIYRQSKAAPCSAPGCDRPSHCRNLCDKHYQRVLKAGGDSARVDYPAQCTVDRCFRPVEALGMCQRHYLAWRDERNRNDPDWPRCPLNTCAEPSKSRRQDGLCAKHAARLRKNGHLGALSHDIANVNLRQGIADCELCGPGVPLNVERSGSKRIRCQRGQIDIRLRSKFGITINDYDAMLNRQGGVCAICSEKPDDGPRGMLVVDHCHTSLAVRALLCGKCNCAIGLIHDNPQTAWAMMNYLAEHASRLAAA